MTNGEKIQQMFPRKCPHIGFNENFGRIWLMQDGEDFANFTLKWWNAEYKEPTTQNDLEADCISREQAQTKIEMNASRYTIARERGGMGQVEWSDQLIKVSDAVDIIRNLPSVTPQPRKGYLSIDDVMSVFDDFMCGEVDEDGTETFLEMLKDKADMREVENDTD